MVTLRTYQKAAVEQWLSLIANGGDRATLVLPTGTGKTVVAAQLLPTHEAARTVFFVPTVVLLEQTSRVLAAAHPALRILRVCSPTAPALTEPGSSAVVETELTLAEREHISVTTDPEKIASTLAHLGALVLIATYASSPAVHTAAGMSATTFDLTICDEAHHTAGAPDKAWALPVRDEFPTRTRLFMTATARTIVVPSNESAKAKITELGWDSADVITMDDPATYGPHITTLSFREAIKAHHLSDYTIAVIGITSHQVRARLKNLLNITTGPDYTLTDAAAHLALARATISHPHVKSVMAFHNRVAASQAWTARVPAVYQDAHAAMGEPARGIDARHIDGATDVQERELALKALAYPGEQLRVVSNCRVFAEGVDVPALDAVLFAAPRNAGTDIVQIVGRAIRKHPAGSDHKALIIVPVLLPNNADDKDAEAAAARSSHLAAWRILTSLADQDELLHQSLLTWREDHDADVSPTNSPLIIDIPADLGDYARHVFLRTIERTIPNHTRTAAYLRDFQATYGDANPKAKKIFRHFQLGKAVREARAAKRNNAMSERIVAEFEAIPGFSWNIGQSAPQRDLDQWIDLIELYVSKTRIRYLTQDAFVIDPRTGTPAKIGRWYHDAGKQKSLTAKQKQRLKDILGQ